MQLTNGHKRIRISTICNPNLLLEAKFLMSQKEKLPEMICPLIRLHNAYQVILLNKLNLIPNLGCIQITWGSGQNADSD